ncbi:DUF2953 domain-containing protein [Caproicibacterium sp. XB2]|uniref:DUF2953 domain-containing protein n=2 Tax=Caproicibacterium TaxID=2834348 RepID=UPI0038510DFC
MTFLKVFLIMNAVFFLLSMASVRLRFSYYDTLHMKISYLFFSYMLLPQKEKKKAKKKQPSPKKEEKPKQKKENIFHKAYRERGLSGLLHLLKGLADMASGALKTLFRHIRAKQLSLHISVAERDAATTAVKYGYVCAAVYPAFSVLTQAMRCRAFEVAVVPSFHGIQTKIQGTADVKIRVVFLITALIRALMAYMKLMKSAKINSDTQNQNRKGGAENERQQPSN